MSEPPIIAIDAATKCYGESKALDAVSLDIERGAFVALVGTSGSGKTTLLKTINGLVAPDDGTVRIAGTSFEYGPELRREIGYVFQGIGLFPHMTVVENIAVVQRLEGVDAAGREARAIELLDLVALPRAFAARMPAQLSGGQAQRVGIARALAAAPNIMLMDEPFGALDPVTRDALGQSYRKLHDELGLTTLMVTHDIGEALLLADRVVVMEAGRTIADAPPAALMAGSGDPAVEAMLAVPRRQAERLLGMAAR